MATIHEQQSKLEALKRELEAGGQMTDTDTAGGIVLTGAQIDDQGLSWIEVMPTAEKARNGSWFFTVTANDLGVLADYIRANPDRIPIDYDHAGASDNPSTRAAGWFTGEAQVVDAGGRTPTGDVQEHESVWAQVKWTPSAVTEIRDGVFRFISPEWHFGEKDAKTGLMTKLKDLAAATLTNRPFFKDLAPVTASILEADDLEALTGIAVRAATADGQTVSFDPEDIVVLQALDDLLDEILGEPEPEDVQARSQAFRDALRAATWSTGMVNDFPDSSFLYIESGGTKDADGKTTPRSLRHFPVRDAGGNVDLAHVRNALARIPQSNVPEAAKASATAAAEKLLKDAGGNPSATDQGIIDEDKEIIVADEQPVTDYMKMLGLDETVDPKHRLAAAFRDKDEKILALEQKVTELTAAGGEKSKQAEEFASRVEELEQKDRARDIEVILARAVEKGRVLPAEKETLAEVFAADVNGLKRMIATRPADMFVLEAKGTSSEPDRFADEPDVAEYVKTFGGGDPVDTEQAKQHLMAMDLLKEQGKADTYTNDEYVAAYERARTLVY